MEITIINSLKKPKIKSKSKSDESSAILENGSQIKLKDIDINKTVKEFKDHIYTSLNLSSQISRNRLGIMVVSKKDSKEIRTFLSDDFQKLLFYDGVGDTNSIFYLNRTSCVFYTIFYSLCFNIYKK